MIFLMYPNNNIRQKNEDRLKQSGALDNKTSSMWVGSNLTSADKFVLCDFALNSIT